MLILWCVCVFFTLNRSSTRRHPAHPVSVLILHPRKISSVVTSHDTEIMHRNAYIDYNRYIIKIKTIGIYTIIGQETTIIYY